MQTLLPHFVRNNRFHGLFAWCLVCCFTGIAPAASAQSDLWFSGSSSMDTFGGNPDTDAFIRIPSDTDDWTRHFRIGALVGMNISANFKMAGTFNVNQSAGVYDDGYVHPSDNGFVGTTTDWSYDSASQYIAATHTLNMTGTTSFSTTGSAGTEESGSAFAGFDLAYGDNLWYWKHARVGWEFGFGLLPVNITDNQPMSGQINQNVYSFSTGTIESMPPPGIPGPSSGSWPAIYSTAASTNQTSNPGTITGTHSLDVMLYTFRLGPTFYWDLGKHVGVTLGAGPALGVVSGDYKYNETINTGDTSAHNTGSFGTTDVVFGGYVNAMVMCHVVDNGDIYVGAQYMPMENAGFSSGGRQAQLNLGGQVYISAGINWPF
jgi:hypothetical protein